MGTDGIGMVSVPEWNFGRPQNVGFEFINNKQKYAIDINTAISNEFVSFDHGFCWLCKCCYGNLKLYKDAILINPSL